MQLPALTENRDHWRPAFNQRPDAGILLDAVARKARGAKRHQPGLLKLDIPRLAEKFLVPGIRSGPSAFDVIDPQLVQLVSDQELVLGGKAERFALRAVSKRCIKRKDPHKISLLARRNANLLLL